MIYLLMKMACHTYVAPIAPSVRVMETSGNQHQRISRSKATLLIGLAVVIVAGGLAFFFSRRIPTHSEPHVSVPASSNASMFGFNLQHTRFIPSERILNTSNVSHLVTYWRASTGSYIISSPTVASGIVYIGSNDQKLYALDAKTGKMLWFHDAQNDVGSSPAVAKGIVYVGSDDHTLYALNGRTGATVWTYTTGGAIWSSPAVANGVVYIGSNDSLLYALDAVSGTVLWSHTTDNFVSSSPAVVNGVVYVGSEDDNLYALDARKGKTLWIAKVELPIRVSSPAVINGVVYIGSEDRNVYAFDALTGKSKWKAAT